MRGVDERTGSLFSFLDLEARVPKRHPLRKIRQIVNDALAALDGEFSKLYASEGRPSIAPENCCAPRCCRRSSLCAPSAS
jgi:transposase